MEVSQKETFMSEKFLFSGKSPDFFPLFSSNSYRTERKMEFLIYRKQKKIAACA